jgi:hypothetical protein
VRLTSSQVAGLDDQVVAHRTAAHLDPVEPGAGDPQLGSQVELHLAALLGHLERDRGGAAQPPPDR